MVLVGREAIGGREAGGNLAALLLAEAMGGGALLGGIAAVAFTTILAVVAGLTLAGATTVSHDLYAHAFRKGESSEEAEMRVARRAALWLGVLAIALGLAFEGQNVAVMVGLAFSIAASANFPALLLTITWRRTSTFGATLGIATGVLSAAGLILASPTVWVELFGFHEPLFPWRNPALLSMPLAFVATWLGSLLRPDPRAERLFDGLQRRIYLGAGTE